MIDTNPNRRRFLLGTAGSVVPVPALLAQNANAQAPQVKQIVAGALSVGYREYGPNDGPAVILLHGWPYDIHSFEDAAPLLAQEGYRVIVPYLRGFGSTRFLSNKAPRNGQQAALAADALALLDALKIERATFAGFDWGARTAVAVAALWPARCRALISVSGYLIANIAANRRPLPPTAERGWWYQYYFSTERGRIGYQENRDEFNRLIWKLASPKWNFDNATFERTAESFQNPDHVDIVIHNYRWRLSLAKGEKQYEDLERRLQASPVVKVPTVTIGSDFDGATADGAGYRDKFSGKHAHRVLAGIGHNVPQEAPGEFAQAVLDAIGL